MEIYPVTHKAFRPYGRIVRGFDTKDMIKVMEKTPTPDEVIYIPSCPELEALPSYQQIQDRLYGGMPIQIGYCNGDNHQLNALEYHRDSEFNLACTDLVLLVGRVQDIDLKTMTYDTKQVMAFLVPAGMLIECYATTLHYAPVNAGGRFRCVIILPKGTNLPLEKPIDKPKDEERLLFATNKWLICHPDTDLSKEGVYPGLVGKNLTV